MVSFGFGCGRRNFPGAYVDVSQYNNWITECVNSNINHEDIPRPSTVNPRYYLLNHRQSFKLIYIFSSSPGLKFNDKILGFFTSLLVMSLVINY